MARWTVRYFGRIAVLLSLSLLGGVAVGQDADGSGAPAPETAAEGAGGAGGPATPAEPAATDAAPSTERSSEPDRASTRRRARHSKASGSTRRSRRSRRGAHATSASSRTTPPARGSLSVGRHNRGRLLRSAELLDGDHVRLRNTDSGQHHGTEELVAMLEHAADLVWSRLPGVRLTIGDLSRHNGGRFRPHRSHQSGRDVDVGFYLHDDAGSPIEPDRFFEFRDDGTSRHDATWHFDDARNWALVEAFVTNTIAVVQYAFVSRELRRRLLDYGAAHGADPETLARAESVLWQPSSGGRHRDHFHVRVYCDAGDRPRCRDEAPYHPWTRGSSALAAAAARAASGETAEPEDVDAATDEAGELEAPVEIEPAH